MTTNLSRTIKRISTSEALVNALRIEILDGTLPQGTRLTEADLAETRGVSRHTIKLALTEMASLGLVIQRPHKGVWVREMSDEDITDLYWVRWILEFEAVSQVAMDSVTWDRLDSCVRSMERMPEDTPWSEVAQADWRFHSETVACTGSARLLRAHEALEAETLLSFVQCRPEDDPQSVAKAHRALLNVIRTGDATAASDALRVHLEQSRQSLIETRRVVPR